MAGFRSSNPAGVGFGDNSFFGSQNNTPDETNGISNAVNCYKEAVQFSASSVMSPPVLTKSVEQQQIL